MKLLLVDVFQGLSFHRNAEYFDWLFGTTRLNSLLHDETTRQTHVLPTLH